MLKKNIAIVFFLTLLSKALGFFRDIALVNQCGAGSQTDLLFAVNSIIETIICFFGIQTLFSSSTKLFSEVQHDLTYRNQFFTSFSVTILLISIPLMIIIASTSDFWIKFLYPGFNPAYQQQGAFLLKFFVINIPILAFLRSFNSVLGVHSSFYLQNLLPAISNIIIIFIIYTTSKTHITFALLLGMTILNVAFFMIQSVMLNKFGYRFSKLSKGSLESVIKRVAELTGPLVIVTMSNSIFLIFIQYLASSCQNGTVTLLSLGSNLVFFSVGLIFMSILSVAFPSMTQLLHSGNEFELKVLLNKLFITALFIFIPVSIFFIFESKSIVTGIFFSKNFTPENALLLSEIIHILGFAILPMVIYLLLNYLLQTYAKNNLTAICSLITFVIGMVVIYIGYRFVDSSGIAIGLSTYHFVFAITIVISARKIIPFSFYRKIFIHASFMLLLSILIISIFNFIPFNSLLLSTSDSFILRFLNPINLICKSTGLLLTYVFILFSYRLIFPDSFTILEK